MILIGATSEHLVNNSNNGASQLNAGGGAGGGISGKNNDRFKKQPK